ncbi:MAG: lldP, partial [Armatimonadetes bacterium]|nr:lldP [Armatimonadota bacterium]
LLLLGFILGALCQKAAPAEIRSAMAAASRQIGPVFLALVAMLGLSRVMVHSGMIETLALGAASTGAAWPLLAPFVGVLGTFVTGSATASNILFTDFQEATATHLQLPVLPLIGAQGFGAGVGNVICPHNLIAGGATVGLAGAEGEVLRRTILPCLGYALLGGGLAYLLTR